MAEYIDREQIERVRLEDSCYVIEHIKGDEIDCIIDAPAADVIERSRYEQLDKEADALSKAYQEEHEKYKQLRLNVAKAIEEMDKLASHKVMPISFDQAVAIDMCIEILKKNMGE